MLRWVVYGTMREGAGVLGDAVTTVTGRQDAGVLARGRWVGYMGAT